MKLEWKTCFKAGVSIFLLYLCAIYWKGFTELVGAFVGASAPLLIGCVIAYVLNILMSFYELHYFPHTKNSRLLKSRRPVCIIGAFLTLLAVFFLLLILVIPQLTACIRLIFAELPESIDFLIRELDKLRVLPEDVTKSLESIDWQSKIGEMIHVLTSGIGNVLDMVITTISSVFSGLVITLLGAIFAIYLLSGKEKLGGQIDRLMTRFLKESWHKKTRHLLAVLNDCFHQYIVGQCTEAVLLGLLCSLGMMLCRLPYAAMIGSLVGFTALIPVAGAYIGAGVGAFMIFTVSPVKALVFLIFIVILQQLEGNLIYPRVVGSSIGLPAIWVLAAITIGGGMLGIAGMLIGVPLAAAVYRLLQEDMRKNQNQRFFS